MNVRRRMTRHLFLVMWVGVIFFLGFIGRINAQEEIGPLLENNLFISTGELQAVAESAEVAFDGERYLVVWAQHYDYTQYHACIYGRFITKTGLLDGEPFLISLFTRPQMEPAVAFNGTYYLVVYYNNHPDEIRGRLVGTDGFVIGPELTIRSAANTCHYPDVASDGSNFLVVWADNRGWSTNYGDIYGQLVTLNAQDNAILSGNNFRISPVEQHQFAPSVEFGDTSYLVTWTNDYQPNAYEYDLYGALVSSTGVVLSEDPIAISTGFGNQGGAIRAGIAYDGTNYLVVYGNTKDWPQPHLGSAFCGTLISGAGVLIQDFQITTEGGEGDVTFCGAEWFVVWGGGIDGKTRGARVSTTGDVLDLNGIDLNVPDTPWAGSHYLPRVSFDGDNCLVTWRLSGDPPAPYAKNARYAQLVGPFATNSPPTADAGTDQIGYVDTPVTLDGSASIDPDEDLLSYLWTFEVVPPGSSVVFSDPTAVNPTFTPDVIGNYLLKLVVSDGTLSSEDSINITVFNTSVSNEPVTFFDAPTGTSITFQEITSPGNTTVVTSQTNPVGSLDQNFKVRGVFLDISTTAIYSGNIEICLNYSQLGVNHPNKLKLLHWESVDGINYEWVDVTTSINEVNGTICGSVSGLSWFVLVEVNYPPAADAGENIAIKSEEQSTTTIIGTGTDQDTDDILQYRWKEGEIALLDWTPVEENGNCPLELSTIPIGIGTHTLTLDVSDGYDISSDTMILTIENSAPHAAPTGSGVYDINTEVKLGGQVSDFDGDPLNYLWLEGGNILYSGNIQTTAGGAPVMLQDFAISSLDLGIHTITLQVSDGINDPQNKEIIVEIVDTTVPTLAPIADTTILWPPNHKMVNIVIQANASDNSGLPVTLTASVTSNEQIEGLGDGDMAPDWTEPVIDQENGIITLQLRAERSGTGDGRVYTLTITATDQSGNSSTVNIEIIVPHDKRKN